MRFEKGGASPGGVYGLGLQLSFLDSRPQGPKISCLRLSLRFPYLIRRSRFEKFQLMGVAFDTRWKIPKVDVRIRMFELSSPQPPGTLNPKLRSSRVARLHVSCAGEENAPSHSSFGTSEQLMRHS